LTITQGIELTYGHRTCGNSASMYTLRYHFSQYNFI